LEFADRGNNTLLTLEDSSRPARLLVAVRRGEDALPFAEVDRRQGCLVHLPVHLLQSTPGSEAACSSLQPHRRQHLKGRHLPRRLRRDVRRLLDLLRLLALGLDLLGAGYGGRGRLLARE